jgi:predicted component of type VI protein secretion system
MSMSKKLEDLIESQPFEVAQSTKELAEVLGVRIALTKLLSNLGPGDVPAIDPDVLDSLLSLKRSIENQHCRLSLFVHMPDGTHYGVNL